MKTSSAAGTAGQESSGGPIGNGLSAQEPAYLWVVAAAPPRKQIGREIDRGMPFPMRARRDRLRIGIRRDHLAIEMPGGVAEQWDNNGKPKEQRQRSQNQQCRDDQSPRSHRDR